ncbi:venom carboxylesterase-6-like isoform X1 [Schistocerca serialis cubense]|uniref:venom carboxylesterase-6-like isoform X1 n=2 Tax=Schistocerca serialis cubense TaxID=2023355 RepID=UPI00214E508B|nr:venom carboxylesterase-6-like isoform X1 [Schistocerca serialis cubense]
MAGVWSAPSAALLQLLLVLAVVVALLCSSASAGEVVRTRQGALRGTSRVSSEGRPFHAFYRIPYAKPPVGPLRFRSPQPPDTWTHIRDATTPGPVCTQYALIVPGPPLSGAEDCLYLNVFTPQLKHTEPLPVMFWIHGGGWVDGGGTAYGPDFLMNHDVVLVTINYRLGPLGFLSTEDAASPGNFGLKDQVAALRWVRENIEAFGGDPGSVTIFGESAGGASVHYHMLSPLSKGLFHRAISQSGVSVTPWGVPRPGGLQKAQKVAALVGCPTEPSAALVDCLRSVDDYKIVNTTPQFTEWFFSPLIPFRPAVEGEGEDSFLPKHPLDLKPHTAVPWITGATHDEGYLFAAASIANKQILEDLKQDGERLLPLSLSYDGEPQADLVTKKIKDFYFSNGELSASKLSELYTDGLFIWNADEAVRKYKDTAPVYYYLLSYRGKYRMTKAFGGVDLDLGVSHADDLFYLFSNNPYYPTSGDMPEKDYEVVKAMTKLWTNFAKTGNPTPDSDPVHWPRVTSDDGLEYLDIGEQLEVKEGLFQQRTDFWRSLPLRETKRSSAVKEEL